MATYITVEQQKAAQLLDANRQQTQANRIQLMRTEAARAQPVVQQQPTPIIRGSRPVETEQELAAFRRLGFKADFLVLSYQFTTGEDLDTRTKLYLPTTQVFSGDVGWSRGETIEVVEGVPIVTWAGDNTDKGFESVLIDVAAYKSAFPGSDSILLYTAGNWNIERGQSVVLVFKGYLGGTMILQPEEYNWINPDALRVYGTYPVFVSTAVQSNVADDVDGDFIAYVSFNLLTGRLSYLQALPV